MYTYIHTIYVCVYSIYVYTYIHVYSFYVWYTASKRPWASKQRSQEEGLARELRRIRINLQGSITAAGRPLEGLGSSKMGVDSDDCIGRDMQRERDMYIQIFIGHIDIQIQVEV